MKSVIEIDAIAKAAGALGEEIGAEAVIIIVLKRATTGEVCSKSRLAIHEKSTLRVEDVQEALLYAVEDIAKAEAQPS